MQAFRWDESFETHLGDVDVQHRKLVDLVNALGELATKPDIPKEIIRAVHAELLAYTEYHFREEERLMELECVDSRHRGRHKREHEGFRLYVTEAARGSAEIKQPAQQLLAYLVHWLTYHILGADQALARQVRAIHEGLSPADAFEREAQQYDGAVRLLLRSVGALFDVLSTRNRELVSLAESLEARIAERTKELSSANEELRTLVTTVEQMAMTDPLTGLPNRRYAMTRLASAWAAAHRYPDRGLSCVLIDADGFKAVNDACGHEAGDAVLVKLSKALRERARTSDDVCRLGGDEFLVICPNTPLDGAVQLGERLRASVAEIHITMPCGRWDGSISVGVSAVHPKITSFEELLRTADAGVYAAKRRGRNCVATVDPDVALAG